MSNSRTGSLVPWQMNVPSGVNSGETSERVQKGQGGQKRVSETVDKTVLREYQKRAMLQEREIRFGKQGEAVFEIKSREDFKAFTFWIKEKEGKDGLSKLRMEVDGGVVEALGEKDREEWEALMEGRDEDLVTVFLESGYLLKKIPKWVSELKVEIIDKSRPLKCSSLKRLDVQNLFESINLDEIDGLEVVKIGYIGLDVTVVVPKGVKKIEVGRVQGVLDIKQAEGLKEGSSVIKEVLKGGKVLGSVKEKEEIKEEKEEIMETSYLSTEESEESSCGSKGLVKGRSETRRGRGRTALKTFGLLTLLAASGAGVWVFNERKKRK